MLPVLRPSSATSTLVRQAVLSPWRTGRLTPIVGFGQYLGSAIENKFGTGTLELMEQFGFDS